MFLFEFGHSDRSMPGGRRAPSPDSIIIWQTADSNLVYRTSSEPYQKTTGMNVRLKSGGITTAPVVNNL